MKRILNALRYGDRRTRRCIGSVLLFSVLAAGMIVVSGLTGVFELFVIGMLFAVVAIIISQSFTLVENDYVAEVDKEGKKESVPAMLAKNNAVSPKTTEEAKELEKASFSHYNEQLLKKVKRKYHVKKDHRPVLVDSSPSYRIKECPAFLWRTHNKVYLLLLEKEPRRICISRELIRHMDYVPNVRADRSKEYLAFQKDNLVTRVFEDYLPDYFDSKATKQHLKYKNLYEIYPDIRFTNRCAYTVMDMLALHFMPEDKITQSEKINGYFKRIYAARILYRDKVYSLTEYKDKVEQVLKELCYADMPEEEFLITLENLVKGKMISEEYANHYISIKNKISGKMVSVNMRR